MIAFAGTPAYLAPGRFAPGMSHFDPFVALGYGCHNARGGIPTLTVDPRTRDAVGSGTDCRTIYYLDKKTGRLAGFWTQSRAFATSAGLSLGSTFGSVRKESGASPVDAPPGYEVSSKTGSLFFGSDESAYQSPSSFAVVAYIEIFAKGDPIGLAFI